MMRTGSIGSCVPPAETTTCRPARSPPFAPEDLSQRAQDHLRVGEPPAPGQPGGEPALFWLDERRAARARRAQVFLVVGAPYMSCSIAGAIRSGGAGVEHGRLQGVLGETEREFGDDVGGRGGDRIAAGALRQPDMLDCHLGVSVPEVIYHRAVRERPEAERRDEFCRPFVMITSTFAPALTSRLAQIDRLVAGDRAAYSQDDMLVAHRIGHDSSM